MIAPAGVANVGKLSERASKRVCDYPRAMLTMRRGLIVFALLSPLGFGCEMERKTRTPSAPPVPDIPLPEKKTDVGVAQAPASDEGDEKEGEAPKGPKKIEDARAPIAVNLIGFVPEHLGGVRARQRQAVKTAPIAYAFYKGKGTTYNVAITGPNQKEAERRALYPLLGKEGEKDSAGPIEMEGLKIEGFDAQKSFDGKKSKAEVVVLVNPFVEVKVSVQPAKKMDDPLELLDEIDLKGVSKLR